MSATVTPNRPLAVIGTPGVRRCLAVSVIARAGDFAVFTYLAAIITIFYGNPAVTVPVALLVNGSAGWCGTILSGRLTDVHGADRTLRLAITGSAIGPALLAVASIRGGPYGPVFAVPALLIWSMSAWGFGPPQQARLINLAPSAPRAALAANASANQLGIGLGGLVGAATIAHATSASIPAIGAVFVVVAAVVAWRASTATAGPLNPLHQINTTANRKAPQ
jgi:predicted MFS family arabinose efflux permease